MELRLPWTNPRPALGSGEVGKAGVGVGERRRRLPAPAWRGRGGSQSRPEPRLLREKGKGGGLRDLVGARGWSLAGLSNREGRCREIPREKEGA